MCEEVVKSWGGILNIGKLGMFYLWSHNQQCYGKTEVTIGFNMFERDIEITFHGVVTADDDGLWKSEELLPEF